MGRARGVGPVTTFPIVLAHGIARFDQLLRATIPDESAFSDATHYFRRIRSSLGAHGFEVHHSVVPWAASVGDRAEALWNNIQGIGSSKVHIIAHSMGGLDARHMLYDFRDSGALERVASITTIGTPHLGTSFADWGLEFGEDLLALLNQIGIHGLDGFRDLTTDACVAFDERAKSFEEASGVLFQTYAGAQSFLTTFAPLKFSWLVIRERDARREGGANDGLVATYSARWRPGYFQGGLLDADHLNQVGWCDLDELQRPFFPFVNREDAERKAVEDRARALYVEIARKLAVRFPLIA